jgi:hypothetical protein
LTVPFLTVAQTFSFGPRTSAEIFKVEEELAQGQRAVRKQIEKAKAFLEKYSTDLEICRDAGDASMMFLTMWSVLKITYQNEIAANEMVQDCLDKFVASPLS